MPKTWHFFQNNCQKLSFFSTKLAIILKKMSSFGQFFFYIQLAIFRGVRWWDTMTSFCNLDVQKHRDLTQNNHCNRRNNLLIFYNSLFTMTGLPNALYILVYLNGIIRYNVLSYSYGIDKWRKCKKQVRYYLHFWIIKLFPQ